MKRRDTGILGEKLARGFIEKQGYHIHETNYRCPEGEINIVAGDGDCLVFVEVRTKRSLEFGTPEESITPARCAGWRRQPPATGRPTPTCRKSGALTSSPWSLTARGTLRE